VVLHKLIYIRILTLALPIQWLLTVGEPTIILIKALKLSLKLEGVMNLGRKIKSYV